MNNNNGSSNGGHRDIILPPAPTADTSAIIFEDETTQDETQDLVDILADELRELPEVWLPSPDDEVAWMKFASEAEAEAKMMGVDLAAVTQAAHKQALSDWQALESPKASRAALAKYLKCRREASGLTVDAITTYSQGFSSQELRRLEDERSPIFSLIENKEASFTSWVKRIGGDILRVLRFLHNCPYPSEWQHVDDVRIPAYHPAGSNREAGTEYTLPKRAQSIIDRINAGSTLKDE